LRRCLGVISLTPAFAAQSSWATLYGTSNSVKTPCRKLQAHDTGHPHFA
jgi:hypothetical protein